MLGIYSHLNESQGSFNICESPYACTGHTYQWVVDDTFDEQFTSHPWKFSDNRQTYCKQSVNLIDI